MMNIRTILLVMLCSVAACGKAKEKNEGGGGGGGGAAKVVASCDLRAVPMASVPTCLEYRGSAWTAKEVKARCALEGQAYLDGPCPTDGVVFACVQEKGKPMEAVNRYYDKKDKAEALCQAIGVPL